MNAEPPDSRRPPLSPEQLAELRRALLQERRRIVALYDRDLQVGSELRDEASNDFADQAAVETARTLALTFSEAERERLREIEQALERMDNGTYGLSEVSGKPIPLERLRAVPWARARAEEQESLERSETS